VHLCYIDLFITNKLKNVDKCKFVSVMMQYRQLFTQCILEGLNGFT
jgi:hypothetical protein